MKLHLTQAEGRHLITGHGPGWIEINGSRHSASLILTPNRLMEDWAAKTFDVLEAGHFKTVVELAPEILLLGTGARLRFPAGDCLKLLATANIGFEVMDTAAASRTYNILMSEGRNVAAALIIEA